MAEEAKIRVRLDTTQAKRDLQDIEGGATQAGERASKKVRGAISSAFRWTGAGAAFGAGMAGIKASAMGGLGDIAGETFGRWGAELNEWAFGKLDDEARAKKSAREDTIRNFGFLTGLRGDVPAAAEAYFNHKAKIREYEELGRSAIEKDPRFYGPGLEEAADKALGKITQALKEGFRVLADALGASVGVNK